jgi:flagellar biosynthesis protein FliQ
MQPSSLFPIALSGNQSVVVLIVALTVSLFQDAVQGDIVVFNFHPKNHSVTQSSFKEPCTPLEGGFDLGLYV